MEHNTKSQSATHLEYEPPVLTLVGSAQTIVLGLPGKGFDGPDGLTEWFFEFADEAE